MHICIVCVCVIVILYVYVWKSMREHNALSSLSICHYDLAPWISGPRASCCPPGTFAEPWGQQLWCWPSRGEGRLEPHVPSCYVHFPWASMPGLPGHIQAFILYTYNVWIHYNVHLHTPSHICIRIYRNMLPIYVCAHATFIKVDGYIIPYIT